MVYSRCHERIRASESFQVTMNIQWFIVFIAFGKYSSLHLNTSSANTSTGPLKYIVKHMNNRDSNEIMDLNLVQITNFLVDSRHYSRYYFVKQ